MGIQGLLPLLKSIMVPIHIKELEGSSVAVDTYSWLHKGAFSCSRQLCNGLPTSKHIDYCMHRINLLRHNGVKPVLVFDGGLLPMKNEQEIKRARTRKENLARAIAHEADGNSTAAYECYQKAVDITPFIAYELIQVLKRENISYVVAPYEADAQMTFLAINNQVDAVLTEDSDLIPFGCPRIIFKMDKYGQGVEFRYDMLPKNKDLSFAGFTKQMFLEMCILSGCDYLQSLPGMGLKRAHALVKKFFSYDKVIRHLRYSTASVPQLYEESFKKAILTFQHQRVYDPITKDIVHLSQISNYIGDDLDFLGPSIPQHIAKGIAEGDIDPCTTLPFQGQEQNINTGLMHERPYKVKEFSAGSAKKKLDLPVQKNVLTKYFCFASLEAKRKFRAPKQSANHPSFRDDSSISPKGPVDLEDNSLPASTHPCENAEGCLSTYPVKYDDAAGFPVSDSRSHDMVNQTEEAEHILLQQPTQSIHKPCVMLHKEPDCKNLPDTIGEKVRKENKRIIIRSSYFKHKLESNDEREKKQELSDQNNTAVDVTETTAPEVASFTSNSCNSSIKKRKAAPNENNIQMDTVKTKHLCMDTLHPDHDETAVEKAREEKFGSNISHLSRYSDIAEKSMDRFVSVISSFRFSSGSRASGLRAPLRDVQNTDTNKSPTAADFSQFAYAPNKHRTPLRFRRGRS